MLHAATNCLEPSGDQAKAQIPWAITSKCAIHKPAEKIELEFDRLAIFHHCRQQGEKKRLGTGFVRAKMAVG
jgi:hypothetical protein